LSFYANEFPVVLVPEKQWSESSAVEQMLDEIIEQATEGFKCIFELDLIAQKNIQERLKYLGKIESFLGGLLLHVNSTFLEDEKLCAQLASMGEDFRLCLNIHGTLADVSALEKFCEQHAISVCWHGEGAVIVPDAAALWLTRCDSAQDKKAVAQQLKRIIAEQLKLECQSREHVLIIDGSPPSLVVTRNASIMMDIM